MPLSPCLDCSNNSCFTNSVNSHGSAHTHCLFSPRSELSHSVSSVRQGIPSQLLEGASNWFLSSPFPLGGRRRPSTKWRGASRHSDPAADETHAHDQHDTR